MSFADFILITLTNSGFSILVSPDTSVTYAPLNIAILAMAYPIFPVE